MNKTEKAYDTLLAVLLFIPVTLLSAYTTMMLWNWFITDTFNLVRLGMWQAYGIDLVVTYLTYKKTPKEEDKPFGTTIGILEVAFVTFVFLVFGMIIKAFI